MDRKGISLVTSALLLVAISVVIASSFYIWYHGTLSEVAEEAERGTAERLKYTLAELRMSSYSEYYVSGRDKDSNGEIGINESEGYDERFIQEIKVELWNDGDLKFTDVKLKVSVLSGNVEWRAFRIDRGNNHQLLYPNGSAFKYNGSELYFNNITGGDNALLLLADDGTALYASDEDGNAINTTSFLNSTSSEEWVKLHCPEYAVGEVAPNSKRTVYVYVLVNECAVGDDIVVRLQARSLEGKTAERSVVIHVSS
ncbi:MAG: hypothetical protein DRN91_06245 [Candidatus Alkanophagales archaeon]|nr:MAG: hypothetical protein DRN91_06245 [Candidatus Alkanophagales archaeon]